MQRLLSTLFFFFTSDYLEFHTAQAISEEQSNCLFSRSVTFISIDYDLFYSIFFYFDLLDLYYCIF
jgi:hypothetical protein